MRLSTLFPALLLSVFLGGCEMMECYTCGNRHLATVPAEAETITVTGYGAADPALVNNRPQQTLMAMRASEVDAFRTLAERIRGVEVTSGTRVDDFVTGYDQMSALLHSYILQNARISSQGVTGEGFYETTLSLTLNERFYQLFLTRPAKRIVRTTSVHKPADDKYNNEYHTQVKTLSTSETHYNTGGVVVLP